MPRKSALRRSMIAVAVVVMLGVAAFWSPRQLDAAGKGQPTDWNRFFYYPYVYYPHNFRQQRGSYDHLYYRYAPNQRVPVYNRNWYNFYPTEKPWYKGHHFKLAVF